MFSLNIQEQTVYFKDIKLEHLPQILKWYNKIGDFKFATGIDEPLTLEVLTRKYAEVAICINEFFVGIYTVAENEMIGILKGRLEYENKYAVWISSIVIDSNYQRRGYGSSSIELALNYFKNHNGMKTAFLSVIEENEQGRRFWSKHNFLELRRLENHIKLNKRQQNIIIMQKILS